MKRDTAVEYLKALKENEEVHVVVWSQEIKRKRGETGPRAPTRFQMETDDHEMYMAFTDEKDRFIRHVKNKSVAVSLMLRALQECTEAVLDRWMAEGEAP